MILLINVFIIIRTKKLLKIRKENKELLKLNWKMCIVHVMWKLRN